MGWRSTGIAILTCIAAGLYADTSYLTQVEFPENSTLGERLDQIAGQSIQISSDWELFVDVSHYSDAYNVRLCDSYNSAGITLKFEEDEDGHNVGYLAYLTKLEDFSGSTLLEAADVFYNAIKPERVFLWDAASVELDFVDIELRPYRILTHPSGLAWYESRGYRPAYWEEVMYMESHSSMGMMYGGTIYNHFEQDPEPPLYIAARTYLRNRTLNDLIAMRALGLEYETLARLEDMYDRDASLAQILPDLVEWHHELFDSCWDELLGAASIDMTTMLKEGIKRFMGPNALMYARQLAYIKTNNNGKKALRSQLLGRSKPSKYMRVLLATPVKDLCDRDSDIYREIGERGVVDLTLEKCAKRLKVEDADRLLLPLVALSGEDYSRMMEIWFNTAKDDGSYLKMVLALKQVKKKHYFVKDVSPIEDAA